MSLYEALDRFVGAGALAGAGLVGCDMPTGAPLDGASFSRFLRERRLGEEFGAVLDALAHEIWLAQDQRGFPQRVCETHAAALATLMGQARLTAGDLGPALESARRALSGGAGAAAVSGMTIREQIANVWLARTRAEGLLDQPDLIEDVARFLLEILFQHVVEAPRFLQTLKPALAEYRTTLVPISAPIIADEPETPAPAGRDLAAVLPRPQIPAHPVAPTHAKQPVTNLAAATGMPLSAAVAAIKERHQLSDGALRRLQSILATQSQANEHRLARLDELGAWLAGTVSQLLRPGNDAAELRRLKHDGASALQAGDFERAMELLKQVRDHVRDDRRRTEARLAEEVETLKMQMIEEATAAARLAGLALARLDYDGAADLFAEAAGNVPSSEAALELDYRQRQAEALASKAEMTGDARALQSAATAFRNCLRLVDRSADPIVWARINVSLGDMQMALGTRNASAVIDLEQAASAYEEALIVIDRAAHPMRWALVQLSNAAALIEIGNRTDRDRYWKAAAAALMPALDVFETRGAGDLAEAARAKLRAIAGGLQPVAIQAALIKPAKSA